MARAKLLSQTATGMTACGKMTSAMAKVFTISKMEIYTRASLLMM
jgi:hypothetical protein